MNFYAFFSVILVLFALDSQSQQISSDARYAEEMIRLFQSFCSSNGVWTKKALLEARKIRNILEEIRDEPNCLETSLLIANHVDTLSQSLEEIDDTWAMSSSLSGIRRQQTDILLILEDTNDEQIIRPLSELYRRNQLNLTLQEAELQYDEDHRRDQRIAKTIADSTSALLHQLSLNRRCVFRSPQIISGVASIISHTGAAFFTGGTSLGFAAASQLLGHALDFIKKFNIDKYIQKLGQGEFVAAYQCVLESLSNQWCEAKEVDDLIEIKISAYGKDNSDIFSHAIDVINRDLPVLNSWLSTLRSPVSTEDFAIAKTQTEFISKENKLEEWFILSTGRLGEIRSRLPRDLIMEQENQSQFTLIQGLVNTILPKGQGGELIIINQEPQESEPEHILKELYPDNMLAWLLLGIPENFIPRGRDRNGNTIFISLNTFTPQSFRANPLLAPYYPLSIDEVKENIIAIYNRALIELTRQKVEILYIDPISLLIDAENYYYSTGNNVRGHSPLMSIDNLLAFFERLRSEHIHEGNTDKMEQDIVDILHKIKDEVHNSTKAPKERLLSIFHLAHLHDGPRFINDRIERIIEHAINNRLRDNEISIGINLGHKLLLAERIIDELTREYDSNLSRLRLDIENALVITEETIQAFAEIFSNEIALTVGQTYKKYQSKDSSQILIARYCSLLLAIPDWESSQLEKIDLSLCYGQKLLSEWRKDITSQEPSFNFESYHQPFNRNRICHYRNFLRREKFYQVVFER